MKQDFREGLIQAMDAMGVTSAELARRTKVSKTLIDKLRQRKAEATNVHDAMRLARFFGKSVEELSGAVPDTEITEILGLICLLGPEDQETVRAQLEGLVARRRAR